MSIFDSQQMTHDFYQSIVIHVFHLYVEPSRGDLYELLEVIQASCHMTDQVLLEHEAPSLDDVEESLLEWTSIDLEPYVKYYCVLEGEREEGREGGREGGTEKEGGRERGREREREREREKGGREGKRRERGKKGKRREGGREKGREGKRREGGEREGGRERESK